MARFPARQTESAKATASTLMNLVLVVGLLLSTGAFVVSRQWEVHTASDEFDSRFQLTAQEIFGTVEKKLAIGLDALHSLGAFFAASDEVTREEFAAFASRLLPIHPGVQSLAWVPRVRGGERRGFEVAAQADFPGFRISERSLNGQLTAAPTRDEYYPVYFIEPFEDNRIALALDVDGEPTLREAKGRARDTASVAISALTTLMLASGPQPGFSAYLPVYEKGALADRVDQRRELLLGFLVSSWRMDAMYDLSADTPRNPAVDLQLWDTTLEDKPQILPSSKLPVGLTPPNHMPGADDHVESRRVLEVGGRQWTLVASPTLSRPPVAWSLTSWLLLLAGLTITGLFSWNIRALQIHAGELRQSNYALYREIAEREKAETAVRSSEKKLLQVLESAPDAILISDQTGRILMTNSQTEWLFGYRKRELVGKAIECLVPEPRQGKHKGYRQAYQARNNARSMGGGIELEAQLRDGTVIPVEISLSSVDLGTEQVVTSIVRDIRARKETEAELQRLNRTYAVLSHCGRSFAEATDEEELLQAFCGTIVDVGGYCQAAIGYCEPGDGSGFRLQAYSSKTRRISGNESTRRFIETQLALAGNQPIIRRDLEPAAGIQPQPLVNGQAACVALAVLALKEDEHMFGSFSVFSSEKNAFGEKEIQLLQELAGDLSIGIASIRRRVTHEQMVRILREEVEQEERKRLAALLHDGVGQSVQAVNLGLKRLRAQRDNLPAPEAELLDRILAETKGILGDLRDLSHELRPMFLERMNLAKAIQHHCAELQAGTKVAIHFAYSSDQPTLTERMKIQSFLCFREAVSNTLAHAKASRVDVTLENQDDGILSLSICDDGVGFLPKQTFKASPGLGLAMIRERVESLGGQVKIISAPGQGTSVALSVPLGSQRVSGNWKSDKLSGQLTKATPTPQHPRETV